MTEVIKIKYIRNIDKIEPIEIGDWIDLRLGEDVHMKQGEFKYLPLGVAMELPKGYEAHMLPRSSTFKNFGVIQTNSMGVIDETYCGDNDEWHFPAYATRDVTLTKGVRICQFRIVEHQPKVSFEEVEILGNKDRGGLGSTGVDCVNVEALYPSLETRHSIVKYNKELEASAKRAYYDILYGYYNNAQIGENIKIYRVPTGENAIIRIDVKVGK